MIIANPIAAETKELREAMQLEDQILRELAERERENARMVDGLKKSVAEKEQTIAEKEQAIAEEAAELKAEKERQTRKALEKELTKLKKLIKPE
jgi:hypothetical protein